MRSHNLIVLVVLFILIFQFTFLEAQTLRDVREVYERKDDRWWGKLFKDLFKRNEFRRSYALVIGLSDYTGEWSPLEAPHHDALRVREFLINKAGFDYVVTLTNRMASRDRIFEYMEEIFPKKLQENDRFLFYYSGHGTQRKLLDRTRGYLPMLESGSQTWANMISMDDFRRWDENIEKVRHVLYVLDCCFSGSAGIQSSGKAAIRYFESLTKYGHHLITAGTENEVSYSSLGKWGGSLFTYAWIEGASGAADASSRRYRSDGLVSLTELYEYIRRTVTLETAEMSNVRQTPQFFDLSRKRQSKGEFFFITEKMRLNDLAKESIGKIEFGWPVAIKGKELPDTTPPSAPRNIQVLLSNGESNTKKKNR